MAEPATLGFIIDELLPANQLHLLAGPSGGGKTTLVWQMLEAISTSSTMFGFQCHTVPMAYVACDRSIASVAATKARMGVNTNIPMWSIINENMSLDFNVVYSFVKRHVPGLKLLVVDGFTVLTPTSKSGKDIGDYKGVAYFLIGLNRLCERDHVAMLNLAHDAKHKENHGYLLDREKLIGSAAWGGYSETIIHIAPVDLKSAEDPRRTITLLPRNAPTKVLEYTLQSGRLEPNQITQVALELFLFGRRIQGLLDQNPVIRTADLLAVGVEQGLSRATTERYIVRLIELGQLERVTAGGRERGMYHRPPSN